MRGAPEYQVSGGLYRALHEGTIIGVIKGGTRSLDYSSCGILSQVG